MGGHLGVFQRPLTLILLQKHRDTNGSRIVIQVGGVYTTLCQAEGILLQKYRDRNGIRITDTSQKYRGQGYEFQYEPQSRNCQIINLRKKWGLRQFQKERLKVRKTALFAQKVYKKCARSAVLRTFRCSLVNLFLTNLVRISGFSSLFSAIAVFWALSGKMCWKHCDR